MAPSIGVNLRVTGYCNQGGRKYMEDAFAVAYQQTDDEKDLEYAYFGIFDGHGGREAAIFAKEHLMDFIVNQKNFWSDKDELVLKAIKEGFVATHMAMWKEVGMGKWPETVSGFPSTAGTTASVVFIRRDKMYLAHVGDSAIVLGFKDPSSDRFVSQPLTRDHKPESPAERKRIEDVGGRVVSKSGVQRVVWNRPQPGHKGPVRRSTHIDCIPFLAVARSLGDLWSYDYLHGQFVISPQPDVTVVTLDPKRDRCIILATDGLWNVISPRGAIRIVEAVEKENERRFLDDESGPSGIKSLVNPSKVLVEEALEMWCNCKKRADNTSVVTVMLDPPGPPKSEVLLRRRMMKKLRPREESEGPAQTEPDRRDSRVLITHTGCPQPRPPPPVALERCPNFRCGPDFPAEAVPWPLRDRRPPLPPKARHSVATVPVVAPHQPQQQRSNNTEQPSQLSFVPLTRSTFQRRSHPHESTRSDARKPVGRTVLQPAAGSNSVNAPGSQVDPCERRSLGKKRDAEALPVVVKRKSSDPVSVTSKYARTHDGNQSWSEGGPCGRRQSSTRFWGKRNRVRFRKVSRLAY